MTLEEAKEQIARQYTGGKHGWYDDYLTPRIKMLLMDDVAKIYAESQNTKYREALERIANADDKGIEFGPLDIARLMKNCAKEALKTGGKQ